MSTNLILNPAHAGQVFAAIGAQVGAFLKGVVAPDVALMARIEAHMPAHAAGGNFAETAGTFIHAHNKTKAVAGCQ